MADPIARWQQSISRGHESEGSSLIANLFESCNSLFSSILAALSSDTSVERSTLLSLERSRSYLVLWADGFGVSEGRFDKSIDKSYRARALTQRLLVSICRSLTKCLLHHLSIEVQTQLQPKVARTSQASEQMSYLTHSEEPDSRHSGGNSESDVDSDTSSDSGSEDLEEIAEDLRTDTQCLLDLGSRFEEGSVGPVVTERPVTPGPSVYWDPSEHFSERIRRRYPVCKSTIASRLGKISWNRLLRCREIKSHNEQAGTEAAEETKATNNKVAGTIMASTAFNDSGLGSSVPTEPSVPDTIHYEETVVSYHGAAGGSIRVPALSDEAKEGAPFSCVACGQMVSITNTSAWKKHLFSDLQPYVCLHDECSFNETAFATKVQWVEHLSLDHCYSPKWEVSECSICHEKLETGKFNVTRHLSQHLEEISLIVLPTNAEDLSASDDSESDSTAPSGAHEEGLESSRGGSSAKHHNQTTHVGNDTDGEEIGASPARLSSHDSEDDLWVPENVLDNPNLPKLDRSITDIYNDTLFDPTFNIQAASPSSQLQIATSPVEPLFNKGLQVDDVQHLIAQESTGQEDIQQTTRNETQQHVASEGSYEEGVLPQAQKPENTPSPRGPYSRGPYNKITHEPPSTEARTIGGNAVPTLRDQSVFQLSPSGDEYLQRHIDVAGERKVLPTGQLLGGREYRCRTFLIPSRGDKLYTLATECARVLGYRESYLLFQQNRGLFKILANDKEKDYLVAQGILPPSYRALQVAIVTALSIFREFGHRIVVDGRRVQDDYWEQRAIRGVTEAELAEISKVPTANPFLKKSPYYEVVYANAAQFGQAGVEKRSSSPTELRLDDDFSVFGKSWPLLAESDPFPSDQPKMAAGYNQDYQNTPHEGTPAVHDPFERSAVPSSEFSHIPNLNLRGPPKGASDETGTEAAASLADPSQRPGRLRTSKPKVRLGCLNCKMRRIKCDERRPACTQCVRSKKNCLGFAPPRGEITQAGGPTSKKVETNRKAEPEILSPSPLLSLESPLDISEEPLTWPKDHYIGESRKESDVRSWKPPVPYFSEDDEATEQTRAYPPPTTTSTSTKSIPPKPTPSEKWEDIYKILFPTKGAETTEAIEAEEFDSSIIEGPGVWDDGDRDDSAVSMESIKGASSDEDIEQ